MGMILLDNGGINQIARLHDSFFLSKILPAASLFQDREMFKLVLFGQK